MVQNDDSLRRKSGAGAARVPDARGAAAMTIEKRPLGRTGEHVSALAVGGHHLGDAATYQEAERIVAEAVDGGITFFDNCWEYNNGRSEEWLGRGLAAGKG